MKILVTGGTGYIGSHTCVELLKNNYEVVIVDNLSNSSIDVVDKIEKITNKTVKFYKADILDENELDKIFKENEIDAVIHFAALKAVGESVQKPLEYYTNNVYGSLVLFKVMKKHSCYKIVFSSSATVYGDISKSPLNEKMPTSTINPYGTSKLMIENILADLYKADRNFQISILRYFNPIGAHESGLLGEKPNGIPNNLMPYITLVAKGKLEKLNVYGNDYNTIDGTGVRDYIHVEDLAVGHLKAMHNIHEGINIYNLGTGTGYSVLQIVETFEKVNNIKINYEIVERREGDTDICFADTSKSKEELGFETVKTLEDMCKSSWNFEKNN